MYKRQDDDDDVEFVSLVLVLLAKFEEKNKAGSTRGFRTAAAPVLANLSSPLDEACLFECVVYFKEREREREREKEGEICGLILKRNKKTNERERERKKSSKKKIISPEFSSFLPRVSFKIPNALTHIHLPLS